MPSVIPTNPNNSDTEYVTENSGQVNEVTLNGEVLMSVRQDTVTKQTLMKEKTAHQRNGENIEGELDPYLVEDEIGEIEDEDYVPFNDVSDEEVPKKKVLFSDLLTKLKQTFLARGASYSWLSRGASTVEMTLSNVDATKADNDVSGTIYPSMNVINDKNGRIIGRSEVQVDPDGGIGYKMYARNYDSEGAVVGQKGIRWIMNKAGNLTYTVDDKWMFRQAIGTVDQTGMDIPSGSDLNTVIDAGVYRIAPDATAQNVANNPCDYAGKLVVFTGLASAPTNNNLYRIQIYYSASGGTNFSTLIYVRKTTDGGATWSAWRRLTQSSEVYNLSSRGYDAQIPLNADLNNYTSSGTYDCTTANTASTLTNCPIASAFKLMVDVEHNSAIVHQTIALINISRATLSMPWRRLRDSNGSWRPWIQYAEKNQLIDVNSAQTLTSADLNNITDAGVYTFSDGNSGNIANAPEARSTFLWVAQTWIDNDASIGVSRVRQFAFIRDYNRAYSRVANYSTETHTFVWSAWQQYATMDDVVPPTVGGGFANATINGTAITATVDGFKLVTGGTVTLYLASEPAINSTLNINGTGAKDIYWWETKLRLADRVGMMGIVTFVYDGIRYRVVSYARVPHVGAQSYVANTSGNIVGTWGYDQNIFQLKYAIGASKLRWNFYNNGSWNGDITIADYNDIIWATRGVNIPNNSNFNSYTTNGIYCVAMNTGMVTMSNRPCDRAGKLIVMRVAGESYITQIYITYAGDFSGYDGIYKRVSLDNGSTWETWLSVAMCGADRFLRLETSTTTQEDLPVGIQFAITDTTTGKRYVRQAIKAYQDHQSSPYGLNLLIEGGGQTIIGSGESASALYPLISKTGENLYLMSDETAYLECGVSTVADRLGFRLTKNGEIIPVKAEVDTNNFGKLGTSSFKLSDVYTTNLNGIPITNGYLRRVNLTNVSSLDSFAINTTGQVIFNSSSGLNPIEGMYDYHYICTGSSENNRKVLTLTRCNDTFNNTQSKWERVSNGTWTAYWVDYTPRGTYIGTCETAGDQRAKVATVENGFKLIKGARIGIRFTNSNTYSSTTSAPVTLNVNNTGAKNIFYGTNTGASGNTGTSTTIYGEAGRYHFYIYDGTNWVFDGRSQDNNSTGYLPTGGGTLTGTLNLKHTNGDIKADPIVSANDFRNIQFVDKNGIRVADVQSVLRTNNVSELDLITKNWVNGAESAKGIWLQQDKNGVLKYTFNDFGNASASLGGTEYGTCSTGADQQKKVATLNNSNWLLRIGAIVGIKFTNTNTYSATADNKITLNVNNTGDKPIYYNTGYPTGTNTTAFGIANRVHFYMYDGTNWLWLNSGCEDNTVDPRNLGFGYASCDTAEATTAKTATLSSYTLRNGGFVAVYFANSVPANATLNINGKGAKNIRYKGSNIQANQIKNGDRALFVYDGTYYCLLAIDSQCKKRSHSGSTGIISGYTAGTDVSIGQMHIAQEGGVVTVGLMFSFTKAKTLTSNTVILSGFKAPMNYVFTCGTTAYTNSTVNKTYPFYLGTDGKLYTRGGAFSANDAVWIGFTYILARSADEP